MDGPVAIAERISETEDGPDMPAIQTLEQLYSALEAIKPEIARAILTTLANNRPITVDILAPWQESISADELSELILLTQCISFESVQPSTPRPRRLLGVLRKNSKGEFL